MRGEKRRAPRHLFLDRPVYGNTTEVPVQEDAPTQPISSYGWSKLMSEIMLRGTGRAPGLGHVILRCFNVAGADRAAAPGNQARLRRI